MKQTHYPDLLPLQRQALDAAARVMENAYNPYSHFYVGATLYGMHEKEGILVSGANVENAAYGSCICAERSAILRANAQGLRKFYGIAIIARGETFDTQEVTGPCGSCRQMLYELSQLSCCDLEIILSTTQKDKIVITTIRELLPLAFGPLDLGIDVARYQK